jgi:hypothetical protein
LEVGMRKAEGKKIRRAEEQKIRRWEAEKLGSWDDGGWMLNAGYWILNNIEHRTSNHAITMVIA